MLSRVEIACRGEDAPSVAFEVPRRRLARRARRARLVALAVLPSSRSRRDMRPCWTANNGEPIRSATEPQPHGTGAGWQER